MYIYAAQITPRLQYIVEELFPAATLTADAELFWRYEGPRLNYSATKFSDGEFQIKPAGLLAESGIRPYPPGLAEWRNMKILFPTGGDLPFDLFSAAFWLLSRYEEYLPHRKDSYGRFSHEESLAFQQNFLHLPLVDCWMKALRGWLQEKRGWRLPRPVFLYQPSYDIDIAYARRGRGWLHRLASAVKGRVTRLNGRDLFDVYDWLDELHHLYRVQPVYFLLMAGRRGVYDKNLSPRSPAMRNLAATLAGKYPVGIHPSWQSQDEERYLESEMSRLTQLTGKKISASRQHYIRFTLPHSFRCLIDAGITEDYSMGYGSINGFRASCSRPFYWYDLMKEEKTSLLLHPFCFMDANACFEQKLQAPAAGEELRGYYNRVKDCGGTLITIFHNHFLTEEDHWLPWREMYRQFLDWHHRQSLTSPFPQEQS